VVELVPYCSMKELALAVQIRPDLQREKDKVGGWREKGRRGGDQEERAGSRDERAGSPAGLALDLGTRVRSPGGLGLEKKRLSIPSDVEAGGSTFGRPHA
jgi:hypothetical protein